MLPWPGCALAARLRRALPRSARRSHPSTPVGFLCPLVGSRPTLSNFLFARSGPGCSLAARLRRALPRSARRSHPSTPVGRLVDKKTPGVRGLFCRATDGSRTRFTSLGSSGNTGIRRSRYMSSPSATQFQGNPRAASWHPEGRCTTVAIYVVAFGDSIPR